MRTQWSFSLLLIVALVALVGCGGKDDKATAKKSEKKELSEDEIAGNMTQQPTPEEIYISSPDW